VIAHYCCHALAGTHYPSELLMGGSSFYYSTFTQAALSSMQSSNVDITTAASLDFFVHAGANVSQDSHYHDWQTYARTSMCVGAVDSIPSTAMPV
jgi:hypothetical protein